MVLWLATTTPRTRLATLKRHTLQTLSILELLSSHSRDLSSFSWCTARFALFFLARPCSCGHSFCRYQHNKRLGFVIVLSPSRPPDSFDAKCYMLLALVCGRPPSFALSCVCPRLLVRALWLVCALGRSRSFSLSFALAPCSSGSCRRVCLRWVCLRWVCLRSVQGMQVRVLK